jgi:hypothetical protein
MTTLDFAKSVPVQIGGSVPTGEVGHIVGCNRISKHSIEDLAVEKYKSCGLGITFEDIQGRFCVTKPRAQRCLKYFRTEDILFTAQYLIDQGIHLIQNTSPQQYFPSCIRAEIIENLNKRNNVLVQPTGVNLLKGSLNQSSSSKRNISSSLENQKAQSFLDVLMQIPYARLYIHKLQLMLYIDKQYYQELSHKEAYVNRAKHHEEIIGRRHVKFVLSPNGNVEIYVRSSDTPFRIETDGDEIVIFSFLGQVRDRLLYWITDIREHSIPTIPEWILKECDLNKDIKIDEKAQLTLPDIQLKTAAGVFRLYIKSLKDRAVCRAEESLKVDALLPEALDNIRYPYKSIESKLNKILEIVDGDKKYHADNSIAARAASNNVDGVGK